jgi:hypothetical protein
MRMPESMMERIAHTSESATVFNHSIVSIHSADFSGSATRREGIIRDHVTHFEVALIPRDHIRFFENAGLKSPSIFIEQSI